LGDLEMAVEIAVKTKRAVPSNPLRIEACALVSECDVLL
jgi:hypothetical protein